MQWAAVAGLTVCAAAMAGCGNTYRPVLATIGAVGPAGQPTKYAIAVSSPSQTSVSGQTVFIGAWNAGATYAINQSVSFQGVQYVSLKNGNLNENPVTSTGFWVQLANGLMTMVDFSGDTTLVTAILGVNPYYLALNGSGTNGYTLNSDKTVTSFDISPQLISSQVLESTLPPGTNPASLLATTTATYISDPGVSAIDQMTGTPPALKQELPVPSGYSPLYMVGVSGAPRIYAITPATNGGPGQVQAIEVNANTISAALPVGRGPVYGVMTADSRRAFILNHTDGTVSVINSQTNALDTPATPNPIVVGPAPVWADFASGLDEMVVVNEGNGTTPGSVSIVDISLCSASALPTNPNCDPVNPIDSSTFGRVVATVPVGINPIMVSVLSDYTRAYVANAGQANLPCAANGVAVAGVSTTCTVSVVNLTSNTVTATIPINGHPVYLVTSTASPTARSTWCATVRR